MKILYMINSLNIGGAEKLVSDIVLAAKEKGIDIDILVLKDSDTYLKKKLIDNKIRVIVAKGIRNINLKTILQIKKLSFSYDIIHTHLSYSQYNGAILKILNKKICLVTTEHSTNNKRRNSFFWKVIERYVYSKYDRIIAITKGVKENLALWQPSVEKKIVVINNGIDISKYKLILKKEKNDYAVFDKKNSIKVLMVGSFRIEKDQETLVRAIALLSNEYELFLVGDGYKIKEIKELVIRIGIQERVHFLGVRDDVNNLMSLSDIFVLSSNWEGFGLVVVEAMATGLPVIATNLVGLADVVSDAGILFNKNDYVDLSKKIMELSNNGYLRNQIIDKGYKRCELFDIKNKLHEHLELYEEVLLNRENL